MNIQNYLKRTDRRCRYPNNIHTVEHVRGGYSVVLRERFSFVDKDGLVIRGACETYIPADEGVVVQFMLN